MCWVPYARTGDHNVLSFLFFTKKFDNIDAGVIRDSGAWHHTQTHVRPPTLWNDRLLYLLFVLTAEVPFNRAAYYCSSNRNQNWTENVVFNWNERGARELSENPRKFICFGGRTHKVYSNDVTGHPFYTFSSTFIYAPHTRWWWWSTNNCKLTAYRVTQTVQSRTEERARQRSFLGVLRYWCAHVCATYNNDNVYCGAALTTEWNVYMNDRDDVEEPVACPSHMKIYSIDFIRREYRDENVDRFGSIGRSWLALFACYRSLSD